MRKAFHRRRPETAFMRNRHNDELRVAMRGNRILQK
jgi:hypothetical protein